MKITYRTDIIIVTLLTACLCLAACERVMPEPPLAFEPHSYSELQRYFSTLRYDLKSYEEGVPRLAVSALPDDFSVITDPREHRRLFIMTLLPLVLMTNEEILADRQRAIALLEEYQRRRTLAAEDLTWLQALAKSYRLGEPQPGDRAFRQRLLRHVDTLPVSLALAQAANESGWGTSRFALEGNNLFGEWTFIKGTGMIPRRRTPGARHEVRLFSDLHASLRSYMHNLNTHRAYATLRREREALRRKGQQPDGLALVQGLRAYSERGNDYVRDIARMIERHKFSLFDEARLR